jgi:hypothetical protein
MTVRSKHNNLLNYFLYDEKDLSKAYIKSCNKFFKDIEKKENIKFIGKFKNEKNIKLEETE